MKDDLDEMNYGEIYNNTTTDRIKDGMYDNVYGLA